MRKSSSYIERSASYLYRSVQSLSNVARFPFVCDVWRKRLLSECLYSDSTPFAPSVHLILIEIFFSLEFLARLTIFHPSCSSHRSYSSAHQMSTITNPVIPPVALDAITQHIGNTPLVRLNRLPQSLGIQATIYAKLEYFNAGGSVKDRIALRMIEAAEQSGRIKPGDTLIEPTSGNTLVTLVTLCFILVTRGWMVWPNVFFGF